ncbi:MAG TPA: EVE domain-containing protein [Patescibacteria group bacterium]|nr:EVE domain-containing protein [Patescibacteria group bacterium]
MRYWLVKSDPESYGWPEFLKEGKTDWTGVRNFQARNNLQAMMYGDEVLFYHSQQGRDIVGIATVTKPAFPDPTAKSGNWVAVELTPLQSFKNLVNLEVMKQTPELKNISLIRQSRLSVMPVTGEEFAKIMELSGLQD